MTPSSHSPIHLGPPSVCKSPPSPVMPFLPASPQPHSSSSSLPTPLLQGPDEAIPLASQIFPHWSLLSLVVLLSLLLVPPCLSVRVWACTHIHTHTLERKGSPSFPATVWCRHEPKAPSCKFEKSTLSTEHFVWCKIAIQRRGENQTVFC